MDLLNLTPEFWTQNENECLEQLNNEEHWNSIPLLNANNLQDLPDKKLVRFYGMVQDMFNIEYYYEKYEVVDEVSLERCLKNGKYVDITQCKDTEVIDGESDKNVLSERQTLVVISIPGLNKWVEDMERRNHQLPQLLVSHEESSNNLKKRSFNSDKQMETQSPNDPQTSNKKQCVNNENNKPQQTATVSQEHLLNFPLPERSGTACHVKVYEGTDQIHLNSIIEVVGFLSVEPILMDFDEEFDNQMEIQTHNPPPSLVPRIHCVKWKKMVHNNPLLNQVNLEKEKMANLKKELHVVLTQLFMGDSIAAEYFICYLISRIYSRNETLSLGKFTLNISHIPHFDLPDYGQRLYEFIETLVSKSYYLPMTLENMNEKAFIPKKDYECNRITSGLLQLTHNTHLILDETKLTPGHLSQSGVRAVSAISDVINYQKVTYDFNYFPMEFDCDIPILILSEGKSLLPSDFYVILKPDQDHVTTFNEICKAAKHFLKPELLNDLRAYLTLTRNGKYEVSDDVQELVQNEFVKMRQERAVTSNDLHQLLVVARLICLSEGKTSLDADCWKRACSLEQERRTRLL